MRTREVFYCFYCLIIIIIGYFDRLLMCMSMPTTTDTQSLLLSPLSPAPQNLITAPGNNFIENWEHVNKTCLSDSLFGSNCDEAINVEHLRDLIHHMRLEVEPCNNFYQYACGNWAKDEKHQMAVNMMKFGDDQVVNQYVELFTQAQVKHHVSDIYKNNVIFEKMLQYFSVCQHAEQTRTSITLQGYAETLHSLGVWKANDSWLETLARLGRYGYAEHYVKFQVKQHNVSQYEMQILPHNKELHVELNREIFEIIKIYTHHTFISLEKALKNLEADLEAIVKKSSADCTSAELDEDSECDLVRYYTYEQLLRSAPTIEWQSFITLHLGRAPQPEDIFTVDALRTIERLVNYIHNTDSELRLIYTMVRFFNYLQEPLKILKTPQAETVNKRCVRHMRKTLYLPMLYVYEIAYYAPRRAANDHVISRIFQQLKNEFALTLKRNDMQLSENSLEFLRAKLETLRLNTGNLPKNTSHQFYIDYIEHLNVSSNFYINHMNSLQHYFDKLNTIAQSDGERNKFQEWYTFNCHSPDMPDNVDSTAYYFVISNMIVMPFAYLQRPFFDNNFWPAFLFGDLANTLGHEMMHSFDNYFLMYDYAGNMADNYKEIFSNYEFRRRLKILEQGTEYLSERIADISGSRLALKTFLGDTHFRRYNGKLYFLQFAQFFCGNENNITEVSLYDPDHDLNSARLNYVVSHLSEFSETFQCPVGSAMNLAQRNIMW